MPGQRRAVLKWPYPLPLLAVGLYGEVLPNQNGAPLRLVVPWKYGFKSVKSIVKIRFVEEQPVTPGWLRHLWLVKADVQLPLLYGGLLALLLGYRVWAAYGRLPHPCMCRDARRP